MGINGAVTLDATAAVAAEKCVAPGGRSWATSNVIDQRQELQRMMRLGAAAPKEAIMTSIWRLQKVKEHAAGEIMAQDEGFDRYMLNASLLEAVFALNAEGIRGVDADGELVVQDGDERSDTEEIPNAMRIRFAADHKRKEASESCWNSAGQVVINNRKEDLPLLAKLSLKVKERPWEGGVEKLERLQWHRKVLRGKGWWKVYVHDETIHSQCKRHYNGALARIRDCHF